MRSEQVLKLIIAYDGTHFAGWQRQKNARTVQAVLEEALRKIVGHKVYVVGAGRTDSGVHAQGQVAHARFSSRLSLPSFKKALNANTPHDVVIHSITPVPSAFHARFDATQKWYRYTIWNSPERPLFNRNFVLHVPVSLDIKKMKQAARLLQGRRDFKVFHSSGRKVSSTVRNVKLLKVTRKKQMIFIDAKADGFLYHMVRRIAGLLIEVGKGKQLPVTPPTAPAKGLCLIKVSY